MLPAPDLSLGCPFGLHGWRFINTFLKITVALASSSKLLASDFRLNQPLKGQHFISAVTSSGDL